MIDSGLLFRRERAPYLLVLEAPQTHALSAAQFLQQADYRVVVAHSIREARELISDLHFIGGSADALLADFTLPDGLSTSVIHEFRKNFPDRPIGVLAGSTDVGAYIWSSLPHVAVLSRAQLADELHHWLAGWRATA